MINLGILGAGAIAGTMADTVNLLNENGNDAVKLLSIGSRSQEKADAFARQYGVQRAYGTYENLLEDPDIDLVYVATPHSHHYRHSRMCLEAGKNVLCEKAFTVNARQAYDLCQLAEKKHLLITEAIWTRYMPMRRTIYDLVWSGKVGMPKMLNADLSYVISQKKRLTDPNLAGGALLDVGVYTINFAEMIFGREDQVRAACTYTETGVDESDAIFMKWKDGKSACLTAGMTARSERSGFIYCTEGYLVVENINNPQSVSLYDLNDELIEKVNCPEQLTGYEYELLEAAEAVESNAVECSSMPHSDTIHIMEVMDGIRAQIGVKYPFED